MKKIVLTWLALSAVLIGAWQLPLLGIPQFKSLHVERLLVSPAHAQLAPPGFPPGVFQNRGAIDAPAAGYDPATAAWVNAVVTAGGTVSTPQKGYVNTLISCFKTNSLWNTVQDRNWLLASENIYQANIDIVNLGTWTAHGTVTFSANHGYTGDGSTGYLDTGFNPSSGTPNFSTNSASLGVYTISSVSTAASFASMGVEFTENADLKSPSGGYQSNINANNGAFDGGASTSQGSWLGSRTASAAQALYQNGSSVTTDTHVAGGVPGADVFIFATDGGSAFDYSTEQIAEAMIGGAFSSAQVTAYEGCLNVYMTSLGINVH
jgi:hypothetical protein